MKYYTEVFSWILFVFMMNIGMQTPDSTKYTLIFLCVLVFFKCYILWWYNK